MQRKTEGNDLSTEAIDKAVIVVRGLRRKLRDAMLNIEFLKYELMKAQKFIKINAHFSILDLEDALKEANRTQGSLAGAKFEITRILGDSFDIQYLSPEPKEGPEDENKN